MEVAIHISLVLTGAHRFPGSTDTYLASRHPHEFGFQVSILEKVPREIEWIELRNKLRQEILHKFAQGGESTFCEFGNMSCEEIAVEVAKIISKYHVRETMVDVAEIDEGCSAEVRFTESDMQLLKEGKTLEFSGQ